MIDLDRETLAKMIDLTELNASLDIIRELTRKKLKKSEKQRKHGKRNV